MAGNGKTRIFAGAAHTMSGGRVMARGGLFRRSAGDRDWEALSTEDSGASWREYRLPPGADDAYAIACA